MGQSECLAALQALGGIAISADIAKFTKNPRRFLEILRRDGAIGCIESCVNVIGGRPKIYYTF